MEYSSKRLAAHVYRKIHFVSSRLLERLASGAYFHSKQRFFIYCGQSHRSLIYYDQSHWAEVDTVAKRDELTRTTILEVEKDCYIFEVLISDEQ